MFVTDGIVEFFRALRAYVLLRAVLHALRDHPAVDACAHLAAQLPTLVRGFYYEGWHPADKPLKYRDQAEFKRLVAAEAPRIPEEALDDGIEAVLKVLSEKATPGEIRKVKSSLPKQLRSSGRTRGSECDSDSQRQA